MTGCVAVASLPTTRPDRENAMPGDPSSALERTSGSSILLGLMLTTRLCVGSRYAVHTVPEPSGGLDLPPESL